MKTILGTLFFDIAVLTLGWSIYNMLYSLVLIALKNRLRRDPDGHPRTMKYLRMVARYRLKAVVRAIPPGYHLSMFSPNAVMILEPCNQVTHHPDTIEYDPLS